MAFSSLYSAVCRGKWFISFHDVEANLILVDKLLERGITKEDATKRSDVDLYRFCSPPVRKKRNPGTVSLTRRKTARPLFLFMVPY